MTAEYSVSLVDWKSGNAALRAVRNAVFIQEQGVPKALEWDGSDPECTHVIAMSADGLPVGAGRLMPDGSVGRMAVLKTWRGQGVGNKMLRTLIDEARKQGHKRVKLSSQQYAAGFYMRHHFKMVGKPYMEAGIPHIGMARDIG